MLTLPLLIESTESDRWRSISPGLGLFSTMGDCSGIVCGTDWATPFKWMSSLIFLAIWAESCCGSDDAAVGTTDFKCDCVGFVWTGGGGGTGSSASLSVSPGPSTCKSSSACSCKATEKVERQQLNELKIRKCQSQWQVREKSTD